MKKAFAEPIYFFLNLRLSEQSASKPSFSHQFFD